MPIVTDPIWFEWFFCAICPGASFIALILVIFAMRRSAQIDEDLADYYGVWGEDDD